MISKWGWDEGRGGEEEVGGGGRRGVSSSRFQQMDRCVSFPPLSLGVQFVYLISSPTCAVFFFCCK